MWTDTTRAQCACAEVALPSDLTDPEWALLEPFFPCPSRWPSQLRPMLVAMGHHRTIEPQKLLFPPNVR